MQRIFVVPALERIAGPDGALSAKPCSLRITVNPSGEITRAEPLTEDALLARHQAIHREVEQAAE